MGDDVMVGASTEADPSVMTRIHCSITFLYAALSSWPSVARAYIMLHRSPIPDSWIQKLEVETRQSIGMNTRSKSRCRRKEFMRKPWSAQGAICTSTGARLGSSDPAAATLHHTSHTLCICACNHTYYTAKLKACNYI